jgi:DnaJ-class molecular chaperone with C-terminal Zn finger domain
MRQDMFSILLVFLLSDASGFCPHTIHPRHERTLPQPFVKQTPKSNYYISHNAPHTALKSHDRSKDSNFLMDQFRTADGEIIDPYRVLKVGRKADKDEIRKSYRTLSKKYHPDGVRFRDVFPGKW